VTDLTPLLLYRDHLLPDNATPFEVALSAAMKRLIDVPVPLEVLWNAELCPEDLLPILAWSMSIEFWRQDWPIERKRYVCRQSLYWHQIKGTEAGISAYLNLADARLIKAIVPPQSPYWGKSETPAERQAYLDQFSQLRLYPFRDVKPAYGDEDFYWGHNYFDTDYLEPDDAAAFIGVNAYLWDQGGSPQASGEETKLRWFETVETVSALEVVTREQVELPGEAGPDCFYWGSGYFGTDHLTAEDLEPRAAALVSFDRRESAVATSVDGFVRTITPSLTPVDWTPDYVAEPGIASIDDFYVDGDYWGDGYWLPDDANLRLYKRFYLFDEARVSSQSEGADGFYWGRFRWGMPPYHAELITDITLTAPASDFYYGEDFIDHAYLTDDARMLERVEDACRAVLASKSKRDKILIDTETVRPATWEDGIPLDGSATWNGTLVSNL